MTPRNQPDMTIKEMVLKYASKNQVIVGALVLMVGYALIPEIKQWGAYKLGLPVSQDYHKSQVVMEKLDLILAHEASKDSAEKVAALIAPYKMFADSVNLDKRIASICRRCQSHEEAKNHSHNQNLVRR